MSVWMQLLMAAVLAAGIWMGRTFLGDPESRGGSGEKLGTIFRLIDEEYVDRVDVDSLVELTIPDLLTKLDPHTVYISASELADVNSELEGSFSGVGVSFSIINDTITVVEVLSGGPAEKVGLLAGDRIVAVDDSIVAGNGVTNQQVFRLLRGEKDTRVKLGISRSTSPKILDYTLTRGDIAVNSVDASYMLADNVGYVKVNKFGRTTYDEFLTSLLMLRNSGAETFVVDLRGNGGGFMDRAILMVNEFLDAGKPIVLTKGRDGIVEQSAYSDGHGSFRDKKVVVLIDEFSASASEIFAGALQDNDRGLIIGRRSFGKGLVQRQIELPDSSAVRLTVSRYYTPSGRCIQKDYVPGHADNYSNEILERYNHGEAFTADSISFNEDLRFITSTGRTVYGGGGIMPDIFVPTDTTCYTGYYINVVNAGLLQKFAFQYADRNRDRFDGCNDAGEVLDRLPGDDALLQSFVAYAAQNGIPARWYYINISKPLLVNQLKALIARDLLGSAAYYEISNRRDATVNQALMAVERGDADFPLR
ncbi:MAG: S41 family peptidase [Muribaculaceae bacterium]|nr:S41 family peptidase [Muribaculaceae bacterium]